MRTRLSDAVTWLGVAAGAWPVAAGVVAVICIGLVVLTIRCVR